MAPIWKDYELQMRATLFKTCSHFSLEHTVADSSHEGFLMLLGVLNTNQAIVIKKCLRKN